MSSLFRKEATEHQRTRLLGEVLIIQPPSFKWLVLISLCSLICIVVFASLQGYKRKETVSGYLTANTGLVKISSDRSGVVQQVLAENGQRIKKGQVLIAVESQRNMEQGHSNSETLRNSLLRELASTKEHIGHIDERRGHEERNLKLQLGGRRAELSSANLQLKIVAKQHQLAIKQRRGAEKLKLKNYASSSTVDQLLNTELGLEQQKLGIQRDIDKLIIQQSNLRNEMNVRIPHTFAEELMRLNQKQEALQREIANVDISSAYTITAALDGYISDLTAHAGETLTPGRTLLIITPDNTKLVGKLLVPSRAAGLIQAGQEVKIQYDAFPYQRFGVFKGTINRIASNVLTPQEIPTPIAMNEAFYFVDVDLAQQSIPAMGQQITLKNGMQLKADITLEERSLLEWLFEPLYTITGRL